LVIGQREFFERTMADFALSARPLFSCHHPLFDDLGLKFGKGSQDVEEELPVGRGGIDIVFDGDEVDSSFLEVVDGVDEVAEAAAEPIEFGHDDGLEGRVGGSGGFHHALEFWASFARLPGESCVLGGRQKPEASGLAILFDEGDLFFEGAGLDLDFGRDAGVADDWEALSVRLSLFGCPRLISLLF